jgi:N-acetylmuramoyl-L-alanine amidase
MKKTINVLLILGLFVVSFFFGRQGAAFVASERTKSAAPCIVIDAGHGDNDPGKIAVNDVYEKDINLAIALKLAPLLENKGYQVVLTRDSDSILAEEDAKNRKLADMQNRLKLIEETNPVITVSIHQNSYPDASVSGPQVFFYEASSESSALASCIQNRLDETLCVSKSRGTKSNTSYYLLKKTPTPTVIVECGFLSNPYEAELLCDELYQEKIVRSLYFGITDFL